VLLSLFVPARALVPIGRAGITHWATRSTLYAAQQVMTAATARGFDTCPMEGFDPARVAKLLALPRGAVIPLVIAVGHRTPDAHLEPQWRRAFDDAVVVH
jgi:nitroreductase